MRLANALSERVNQLVTANGQVGEARLLLMAGLLMADDLHSERASLRRKSLLVRRQRGLTKTVMAAAARRCSRPMTMLPMSLNSSATD